MGSSDGGGIRLGITVVSSDGISSNDAVGSNVGSVNTEFGDSDGDSVNEDGCRKLTGVIDGSSVDNKVGDENGASVLKYPCGE